MGRYAVYQLIFAMFIIVVVLIISKIILLPGVVNIISDVQHTASDSRTQRFTTNCHPSAPDGLILDTSTSKQLSGRFNTDRNQKMVFTG